jgi:acyltransferase
MKKRVEWIDTVKAIGIFLVFYGHYIEIIATDYGSAAGVAQFKFIYSFHIPLFFILSGFFFKESDDKLNKVTSLAYQRIIPVLTFAILSLPLWVLYNKAKFHAFSVEKIADKALYYLGGDPQLNIITWFLICLFTTEVLIVLLGFKSANKTRNAFLGIFFLLAGFFITEYAHLLTTYTKLEPNFWYIHESIVAMGFYLLGNWLYSFISSMESRKSSLLHLLIPAALALLILSNTLFSPQEAVIISTSKHGSLLPFIINSLAGTLLIIGIGRLIPYNKVTAFLGANTLILLGLNGVFFHFVNRLVVKLTLVSTSPAYVTINCLVVTIVSLALCYPVIYLFDKYLPQLFGKPYADGPLLKPINHYLNSKV